jgi:hypothetical protein
LVSVLNFTYFKENRMGREELGDPDVDGRTIIN